MPSENMSGTSMMRPGVAAPMSTWCAVLAENPTSSPSWNTGITMAMSGEWLAPKYGWLWITRSPGFQASSGMVFSIPRR